jgi:hypothetical protein
MKRTIPRRPIARAGALVALGLTAVAVFVLGATGANAPGFKTAKRPYLVPLEAGVKVDPILSTGDIVGGYQMSGIPDGLGAYKDSDTLQVLSNHELGQTFPANPPGVNARISKVTLNDKTHGVLSATYLFNGSEGFERFCSATLEVVNGTPYYFTGEEAIGTGTGHDGSSIVLNAKTGQWTETPQFGHIQHENIVPVERIKKFMVVTTDDDFRSGSPSLLLAYIADSFADAVSGDPAHGSLYVWKALSPADTPASIAEGATIAGEFVPLTQAENANSSTIKTAAAAKGAFQFSRLEDAATAQQTPGRVFFADTGKSGDVSDTGRIYQLDINPSDPTKASLTFLLDSAAHGFANPDNLDASAHSLVFLEDREAPFRAQYGRVLVYDLNAKTLRAVARVDPTPPIPPGAWEATGVINAQTTLGNNWWLVNVQAHNRSAPQPGPAAPNTQPTPNTATGEDGQLLALYIPNS